MRNVLIIEDDSFKSDTLTALVESAIPNVRMRNVSDVVTAVKTVNQDEFDLIIIDMALPSHPIVSGGGAPLSMLTGGLEVLLELNSLQRNDRCIIVTQYPDIEIAGKFFPLIRAADAIKEYFSCEVIACLLYTEDSTEWKDSLSKVLRTL